MHSQIVKLLNKNTIFTQVLHIILQFKIADSNAKQKNFDKFVSYSANNNNGRHLHFMNWHAHWRCIWITKANNVAGTSFYGRPFFCRFALQVGTEWRPIISIRKSVEEKNVNAKQTMGIIDYLLKESCHRVMHQFDLFSNSN